MSDSSKAFDNFAHYIKLQVHTNQPARVIQYYPNTRPPSADIEYLFMSKDKDGTLSKQAMVESIPIARHVGELIKGDVVWVSIAERAMDDLQRVPFDPGMRRMFNPNDGLITAVIDI